MSEVINLCFHGIGTPKRVREPGEADYWISMDFYHRVLDLAAEDERIRLSFDDGNASDVEVGLPGLLERGLTATFFLLAGRLDQAGSTSRAEVRDLVAAGMRVGSHGMHHEPWPALDDSALKRELVDARQILESAGGAPVAEAALPLGRYDRRVLQRARRHGYAHVHTSDRRWTHSAAWLQPRFSLRRDDTVESVRREVLTRPSPLGRARRTAAITVKRFR